MPTLAEKLAARLGREPTAKELQDARAAKEAKRAKAAGVPKLSASVLPNDVILEVRRCQFVNAPSNVDGAKNEMVLKASEGMGSNGIVA